MGGTDTNPRGDSLQYHVLLTKDEKPICRTRCLNPPREVPRHWNVRSIVSRSQLHFLDGLSHCLLCPAAECHRDEKEWRRFLSHLQKWKMVAIAKFDFGEFYVLPPDEASNFSQAKVAYQIVKTRNASTGQRHCELGEARRVVQPVSTKMWMNDDPDLPHHMIKESAGRKDVFKESANRKDVFEKSAGRKDSCIQIRNSATSEDNFSPILKSSPVVGDHCGSESTMETSNRIRPHSVEPSGSLQKNYIKADPSYLQTLGQAHSGWIFGAIAELVDNSRDAKATKLDISIETVYFSQAGKNIPMLSVRDDGHGMNHQEIMRMTYFGHKQPGTDNPNHIGRFGVGFKTGAMRLGKDALVLTQTVDSRSIAFLSQSLNEGEDNLEIPVVSYCRKGQYMELDTSVQSEAIAKSNLKAIKKFSPFDKYTIGQKAGLFNEKSTGTQIYIWNLEEWGSECALEWRDAVDGGSSFHQGDILIRSRRIRSRPGQISQKVPLDYSLRSYLEVIFLVPRMRISVQGSLVKSRALAESLKHVETTSIMGKPVQLTLGCCEVEWEQMNCGIFLYWHGRLIEAYKRVGGMIHNGDIGRGVIGVVDVTDVMDGGNGRVWVHNNKQGFQDCEAYAELEEWLGKVADEYLDKYFDPLQLMKAQSKPDAEWVQCNKCRKWRMLNAGFNAKKLPVEWFCYMTPFNGQCEIPEEKVGQEVITVSTRRTGYSSADKSPPGYGREVKSLSGHARAEKSPPGHGREVQSPPGHGRAEKFPLQHGREVKSPPGHGRAIKSPWCRENATPKLKDGEGSLGSDGYQENVSPPSPRPLKRMRKGLPRTFKKGWKNNLAWYYRRQDR